jgi:hypothetical protein
MAASLFDEWIALAKIGWRCIGAAVDELELRVLSRTNLRMMFSPCDIVGLDGKPAALWHGITRALGYLHDGCTKASRIGLYWPNARGERR